ncbi:MAG: formylmethanofuran dehydrogenase subunit C [Solidesulfovibrio sp. DCME]|uniref:formylmethanofuran dehydrogenase subunit C n=1 Tax=Solidesulfovibrio sp. DCME TaxID=3447380 RepID=UPI003D0B54E7
MHTHVQLTLRTPPDLPVEAQALIPENVAGKGQAGIEALPLLLGNRPATVADFFDVAVLADGPGDGQATQPGEAVTLQLRGDLSRFKHIGERMAAGHVVADGPVGFHAGAFMAGGSLTINGEAGDYLGAHMSGGRITVRGSAGHYVGAAYRGYVFGMTGGAICIHGNAGHMAGARLRRGLVAVGGNCGDLAGYGMRAGTVVIGGTASVRAGANMVRGTVVLLAPPEAIMPTFRYNCAYCPGFWPILHASLTGAGLDFPGVGPQAVFESYGGDINEGGRGEILVCRSAN